MPPSLPGTSYWGTPLERTGPGQGVSPILTWPGGYPIPDWRAYDQSLGYPRKGRVTSGSIMGWRWGNPPPPVLTDPCKNITSRRTTYAGGKNKFLVFWDIFLGFSLSGKMNIQIPRLPVPWQP